MRLLFIGDIVGRSGVEITRRAVPWLRDQLDLDLVIANAENAAGGLGVTPAIAEKLLASGVDGITLGNHSWSKWDIVKWMEDSGRICRPANGMPDWPGSGHLLLPVGQRTVGVINIQGQTFMSTPISPFAMIKDYVMKLRAAGADEVIVDFHAEATAEKNAMGRFLDGEVTLICGTHTHVQTADARILPGGTAYITDAGMTGPADSIIGMKIDTSLRRFVEALPTRYELASGPAQLNAVFCESDPSTGLAINVEAFSLDDDAVPPLDDERDLLG